MFGWTKFGFTEKATEANMNGQGEVWKRIQEWKPFIRYLKTDLIKEKATGETKYTIDIVKCPKWVGRAIGRQLQLTHPKQKSSWYNCEENKKTGLIEKITKLIGEP